jgi:hypothetical protein
MARDGHLDGRNGGLGQARQTQAIRHDQKDQNNAEDSADSPGYLAICHVRFAFP